LHFLTTVCLSSRECISILVLLCVNRLPPEQHTSDANEHTVDESRLDESAVTSVRNESSLVAGEVTVDSVQVHVRYKRVLYLFVQYFV